MIATYGSTVDPTEQTRRALDELAAQNGLTLRSEPSAERTRTMSLLGVGAAVIVGAVLVATLAGWRLVIIRSGSMGDKAPLGSLLVVRPQSGESVAVGDMIVMRRDGAPTITHQVTAITSDGDLRVATTKGDANTGADAIPYVLGNEELTVRFVLPHLGRLIALTQTHWLGILLLLAAAYVLVDDEPDGRRPRVRRVWQPHYVWPLSPAGE